MIRVNQIKIPVFEKQNIKDALCKKIGINTSDVKELKIHKKSLDARKKPDLYYVYELDVALKNEKSLLKNKDISKIEPRIFSIACNGRLKIKTRPIIVGAGPSGLFCAYYLAKYGAKPIIIEQGMPMEDRVKEVEQFLKTGELNQVSNVQFGEGGAGTFSDGKLNTSVKDKEGIKQAILEIFVNCGASEEILYVNKPHIGTDVLRNVIVNLRRLIIKMGGEFRFNTKLTDIIIKSNQLSGIIVNEKEKIDTNILVLAIGHSARDTYKLLNDRKIEMCSKPFAVGLRVQHLQSIINMNQYGLDDYRLPAAEYKLTFNKSGRGVYSFCMCPGGYVINASSSKHSLAINGMSNHSRNSGIANSAIVVSVSAKDYGEGLFAGMKLQEQLEKSAYILANGKIPTQLYVDFKNNVTSKRFGSVKPQVMGEYTFANIRSILPNYITDYFILGMEDFGKKIKGFNNDDVVLMGIESRTSSPIRILRNDDFTCNIDSIYPIGEGAGYSGGIMTSAMDGIKASEKILNQYYFEF